MRTGDLHISFILTSGYAIFIMPMPAARMETFNMDGHAASFRLSHERADLHARYFDDFRLGERFILPPVALTHSLVDSFRLISGETHPLHHDPVWCRENGHPGVLVHGFQVLAVTTAGASPFHAMVENSLLGLVEQSSRFIRPVYAGDTLHPVLQIVELTPNTSTGIVALRSTVHNQRRELVLEGSQRYLLRMRDRLQPDDNQA
ncbi:dehydrogenase with MaoC-like domain [Granulibacter bethesdensis CGDNIH4]|nr:dehydrogenase with MaoC-like domain [Granulibacter bethesdensis CGDNIH4]